MKNETDTELLARTMKEGFGEMNKRFDAVDVRFDGVDVRLDGVDARLDGVDTRLNGVDAKIGGMHDQLVSLERGQAETHRRLDSIEKKQVGMLASLDETVHQSEFRKLVGRVEVLELKK